MAQMAEGAPASRYDWDSQAKHPIPGGVCKWIFSVVYDTHENRKGGRSKEKKKSERLKKIIAHAPFEASASKTMNPTYSDNSPNS